MEHSHKLIITGGAGLVGQNLVHELLLQGYKDITVLDRHKKNLEILKKLFPQAKTISCDLATPLLANNKNWAQEFEGCTCLIQLHAQITAKHTTDFEQSNITATTLVLAAAAAHKVPYIIHASSSVVNSVAEDDYTRSKLAQEILVKECPVPYVILRPTLMFGWFDPKHLGWLSRFMEKMPIFPIPGNGKFMRQPLYNRDFCRVIIRCLETKPQNKIFDLVGTTRINYIDIIKAIRSAKRLRTPIVTIPIGIFRAFLKTYSLVSKNPPFTADQLKALSAGDDFTGVDIEETFGVIPTDFYDAIDETFTHPRFKDVVLSR
jgi:nucleoside-diphosphate-sugar epimerase